MSGLQFLCRRLYETEAACRLPLPPSGVERVRARGKIDQLLGFRPNRPRERTEFDRYSAGFQLGHRLGEFSRVVSNCVPAIVYKHGDLGRRS